MGDEHSSTTARQAEEPAPSKPSKRVKSIKTCEVCGRGFIKLAHLIRHVRTHGDERPFSCSKCDKAFARTDALQRHERAVHSDSDSRDETAASPSDPLAEDGSERAPDKFSPSKKRKVNSASEILASNGKTATTPRSQVDEDSVFHPDFSHLFGIEDHLQDGQQRLSQQSMQSSGEAEPKVGTRSQGQNNISNGQVSQPFASSSQFGVPDFATSHTASTHYDNGNNAPQTIPIASYMAAFPQPYPAAAVSLDASIDSWLTLEGGSHAAENALEMVFSRELLGNVHQPLASASGWENFSIEPLDSNGVTSSGVTNFSHSVPLNFSTPSANNGANDNGLSRLYPFGLQFEDLWKTSPSATNYTFDSGSTANVVTETGQTISDRQQNLTNSSQELFRIPAVQTNPQLATSSGTSFPTAPHDQSTSNPSTSLSLGSASAPCEQGHADSLAIPRRKVLHRVLTTDTWLNSMQVPASGNVDLPRPDITSPEQIIEELSVETSVDKIARKHWAKEEQTAIPSIKFLDSCLHLYFRDFHPTFPIIHKPTFSRHQSSPLLLLSMCSIGCIFMGTQAARERGLWIYERLHHVIVFSRDSRMATEDARVAMTLSGLLGQCFSFLYGEPKHMFTAESFHGCLCTFARRAGLFKLIDQNAVTYDNVASLDDDALEARWQEWARREMLRRVALGLTLHAADAATHSMLPRLVPVQLSTLDQSSDALFEAEDASSWKWLLLCLNGASPSNTLRTPPATGFRVVPTADTLFPMSLMAQKIVNILQLKELCRSEATFVSNFHDIALFSRDMLDLGARVGISDLGHRPAIEAPTSRSSSNQPQILKVMWHYCCLARLARLDQIEEVAGREGVPQPHVVQAVRKWVGSPEARLATLHCAHILHHAADLRDLAFIVPRAIFQATLALLCFIAFNEPLYGSVEVFDATDATDWEHFAEVLAVCSKPGASPEVTSGTCPNSGFQFVVDGRPRLAEKWIRSNCCRWKLEKFIEGKEKQMDYVSLLSTTTRLLRRCTPWGIGDAMGDILATVNLGY